MKFKIENQKIGLTGTITANIGLIYNIENDKDNRIFINPCGKDRHQKAIDSEDEEHLTV